MEEKKFDLNSLIGFVLLGAIMLWYFYNNQPTPEEIAIDKISAYADDQENNPIPTIQDYTDAGVTGVTGDNIDDVNSNIADKMASEVDTTEEIQAVVDSVVNAVSFESDVMPIFEGTVIAQ